MPAPQPVAAVAAFLALIVSETVAAAFGLPLWLVMALLVGGVVAWLVIIPLLVAWARRSVLASKAAVVALEAYFRRAPYPMVRVERGTADLSTWCFKAANEEACSALGYVEAELVDRPLTLFIASQDLTRTAEAVASAQRVGASLNGYTNAYVAGPLHRRPGSLVWLRWSGVPDSETDLSAFVVINAEVEARVRAERERERADTAESDLDALRPAVYAALGSPEGQLVTEVGDAA